MAAEDYYKRTGEPVLVCEAPEGGLVRDVALVGGKVSRRSSGPMTVDIKIVETDDWQILYVNGEKRASGHRLSMRDILLALDIDERAIEYEWVESEDAEQDPRFR